MSTATLESLTPKRRAFAAAYVANGGDAAAAARAAGYKGQGAGGRLLAREDVALALRAAAETALAGTEVTRERIIEEAARLAFDRSLSPGEQTAALRLLGKWNGLEVLRVEVTAGTAAERLERLAAAVIKLALADALPVEVLEACVASARRRGLELDGDVISV